jgi:ABC-2 type transport system ATP-binding protein
VSEKEKNIPLIGSGDPVIAVRRASLWYGQVIGINDITLDIGSGVIGLLGPNGAGKSTFMKVLTGQLHPSTGGVAIHGKLVWNNPEIMSKVGFVPEQDAFYEEMTGLEFVTFLTQLQGFSKEKAAELAKDAIAEVSLTKEQDRPIHTYSKGMRQRIKIAQALAHKPQILFMDEPLTGTDPVGRRHIIELIKKVGEQGSTVIVSSHILHEVEQMTSNILLINKGRVIADGNVYRIREMIDEHPHTIFIEADKNREFAALLSKFDDVVEIRFLERGFQIATRNPDACYDRIPRMAIEHKIELKQYASQDNNLMAVFNYLVR